MITNTRLGRGGPPKVIIERWWTRTQPDEASYKENERNPGNMKTIRNGGNANAEIASEDAWGQNRLVLFHNPFPPRIAHVDERPTKTLALVEKTRLHRAARKRENSIDREARCTTGSASGC